MWCGVGWNGEGVRKLPSAGINRVRFKGSVSARATREAPLAVEASYSMIWKKSTRELSISARLPGNGTGL